MGVSIIKISDKIIILGSYLHTTIIQWIVGSLFPFLDGTDILLVKCFTELIMDTDDGLNDKTLMSIFITCREADVDVSMSPLTSHNENIP